jgi:hypothetical protein
MLKLMRLNEIHKLPVGSDEWKKSVYKYALMSLSMEQDSELKTIGKTTTVMTVGPCVDHKRYKCTITLTTVGQSDASMFIYEPSS